MDAPLVVKPDYVQKAHVILSHANRIIRQNSFELRLKGVQRVSRITGEFVEEFYSPNKTAPHFQRVVDYWENMPIKVIWFSFNGSAEDACNALLDLAGRETDPYRGKEGELRYDASELILPCYAFDANERKLRNIVHRSDSPENLVRESDLIKSLGNPQFNLAL